MGPLPAPHDIAVTFVPHRGYVATLRDGLQVTALALAGLRARLPNARFGLDRTALAEREARRRGGHGGAAQWRSGR